MSICAGRMDTCVSFQEFTASVDAVGSPLQTWTTIAGTPTRAQRIPLRGMELIEASKTTSSEPIKLRIRRDARIVPEVRAVIGSKNFNIKSVEDYGRAGDMVLWCEVKS
jgi:head-tail adaptor